jgi:hypothetical protein
MQEMIAELIKLATELDAATKCGEDLSLTDDEVAFYDAHAAKNPPCKRWATTSSRRSPPNSSPR